MLKVLNLFVIENIFAECEYKLSATTKMIYINCLIGRFRNLTATHANATSFEIAKSEFPNYKKFESKIFEMQKAGLVEIQEQKILFLNVWGKFINRESLNASSESKSDLSGFKNFTAEDFKDELLTRESMFELCGMKYKIDKVKTKALIALFLKEQETSKQKYPNETECIKHCINWIAKQVTTGNATTTNQTVKSNNKLLGS